MTKRKGDSMYVCGSPGTGKTLSLNFAINALRTKHGCKVRIIQINAMQLSKPTELYTSLYKSLGGASKPAPSSPMEYADAVQNLLSRSMTKQGKQFFTLIVVDEIDQLLSKAQTVLYRLFQWPKLRNSSMSLIGIANSIDLTNRFLPRLKQRFCDPQLVVFQAYNKDQLATIVKQRIRESQEALEQKDNDNDKDKENDKDKDNGKGSGKGRGRGRGRGRPKSKDEGTVDQGTEDTRGKTTGTGDPQPPPVFFHPAAIELCARKVASRSGDVRKCLDICGQCVSALEMRTEKGGDELVEDGSGDGEGGGDGAKDSAAAAPMVKVGDMLKHLNRTMSSPILKTIATLPPQQQMVLCVAAIWASHLDELKLFQLRERYISMAKNFGLPNLSSSVFTDIVSALAETGAVSVSSAKSARSIRAGDSLNRASDVRVIVSLDDLREVLVPLNSFFGRILDRGESMSVPGS